MKLFFCVSKCNCVKNVLAPFRRRFVSKDLLINYFGIESVTVLIHWCSFRQFGFESKYFGLMFIGMMHHSYPTIAMLTSARTRLGALPACPHGAAHIGPIFPYGTHTGHIWMIWNLCRAQFSLIWCTWICWQEGRSEGIVSKMQTFA